MIQVTWRADIPQQPNLHPAFSRAQRVGDRWVLDYPTGAGLKKSQKAQAQWADDKIRHLRTFGVVGERSHSGASVPNSPTYDPFA